MSALTAHQIRHRYLILHALRWLPSGLLIPVTILLMQERGMTLAQIGLAVSVQGLIVLALELPTGGFADALGSKPILVTASVVNLVSLALFVVADSFALLAAVFALQGVFRALDSGPLESWYVNATLAADPDAEYERGLGHGGAVLGVAIALGALLSGGLVLLGGIGPVSALTLPVLAAAALQLLYLAALLTLLADTRVARGGRTMLSSVRDAPRMVGRALRLVRRSRILLALLAVEAFWGFGMMTFEGLLPVRLAEVAGDPDRAAALLGPASAVAWLASAGGAAAVPLLSRRIGAAPASALLRIVQGVTVVGMGLLAGPVGVLVAYLACYAVHGASNPLHMGLLHRQVDGPYRTSVISLNSMVAMPAAGLGGIALGALADSAGVTTAMLAGAVVLTLGAPLYLPAWRAGRSGGSESGGDAGTATPPGTGIAVPDPRGAGAVAAGANGAGGNASTGLPAAAPGAGD